VPYTQTHGEFTQPKWFLSKSYVFETIKKKAAGYDRSKKETKGKRDN